MLKPSMRHFVCRHPQQTRIRSISCDQRTHCILHSAITPLNNRVLFPRIITNIFIKKVHQHNRVFLQLFPIFFYFFIIVIKKMKANTIRSFHDVVYKIRISCPSKIMHFGRIKIPPQFIAFGEFQVLIRVFISMPNLLRIL